MIAAGAVVFALVCNWACYRWGRSDERREWLSWAHALHFHADNVVRFPRRSA